MRELSGFGDSPQLALDHLAPERIRMARERRGLTGKKLAEMIEKTPGAVSQFETGRSKPDLSTFLRLSMALGVPSLFFARRPASSIPFDYCHFRARRSVAQRERKINVRWGELLLELIDFLELKGVVFPEDVISSFEFEYGEVWGNENIEFAATRLRRHLGLGVGPIPHIVKLLESKGIFVFPLPTSHIDVDAYSVWAGLRPCVMLALNKSASRARFDAAHELGHLVLHRDKKPGGADMEREVDRFAGAFLAPRESFAAECPRRWNFEVFLRLKHRWRISIAGLVVRGYQLGILSHASYTTAFRELSEHGYRKAEPGEWPHERPSLLTQAMHLLKGHVDLVSLADELAIHPQELHELLVPNVDAEILAALRPQPQSEAQLVQFRSR